MWEGWREDGTSSMQVGEVKGQERQRAEKKVTENTWCWIHHASHDRIYTTYRYTTCYTPPWSWACSTLTFLCGVFPWMNFIECTHTTAKACSLSLMEIPQHWILDCTYTMRYHQCQNIPIGKLALPILWVTSTSRDTETSERSATQHYLMKEHTQMYITSTKGLMWHLQHDSIHVYVNAVVLWH